MPDTDSFSNEDGMLTETRLSGKRRTRTLWTRLGDIKRLLEYVSESSHPNSGWQGKGG